MVDLLASLPALSPNSGQTPVRLDCPLCADFVAKVESCRATNFSRKHEPRSNRRFV
jgi:hypothetical protein